MDGTGVVQLKNVKTYLNKTKLTGNFFFESTHIGIWGGQQISPGPFFRIPYTKIGYLVNFHSRLTLPGEKFEVERETTSKMAKNDQKIFFPQKCQIMSDYHEIYCGGQKH